MGLEEYKRKRRFNETPEPEGRIAAAAGNGFVIQKHRATRLHYDFRLEMDGVLRSWAVPKGPSLDPDEKRLAVETEDHPLDYGDFEGVIPKGNYGAGKVIVWERGGYRMIDPATPEEGWRKGKLHFVLNGSKLRGEWVLVRGSRDPKQWIFFKVRDQFAAPGSDILAERPESVISGRLVEEIGEPDPSGAARKSSKKKPVETRHWFTPLERALERYGMKTPGRVPLPRQVRPMLATLSWQPFDGDEWIFELKLDGIRAMATKEGSRVEMHTRNDKPLAHRFPGIAATLAALPADSMIVDGEIVVLDEKGQSHFDAILPRIHLSRPHDIAEAERNIPAYFYAFDLLYVNGFDLTRFPLLERKAVLRELLAGAGEWVRYTDHIEGRGKAFFQAAARHGAEGVVAKHRDSPYRQDRSRHWVKVKTQNVDRFVVGGYTPPDGARKYFGTLLLGLYDAQGNFVYVGRAGGGFDDRGLEEAHRMLQPLIVRKKPFREVPAEVRKSTWVEPRLVCEVRFAEWTPDRILRMPVFQGFRDDVDPAQCTLAGALPPEPDADRDPAPPDSRRQPRESGRQTLAPRAGSGGPPRTLDTRAGVTNLDKPFWPEDGLTKGDLIRYYDRIAPYLQPHLADRPLIFQRYPDGIHGDSFYQKDAPGYVPDWIRTHSIWAEDSQRDIRYFVGNGREQLIYIANMGAITQNPWSSRLQFLDSPDYAIFDLDPVDAPYATVQRVALELKAVLDELKLRAYPKTSGATGIHVYLPVLENTFSYEDIRLLTRAIAAIVVERLPGVATIERSVSKRKTGSIYVDYLQNVRGKTVASVYSPRARPGAPVSAPLSWEEFRRPIQPGDYTMTTIFERIGKYGDLFAPVLTDRQDIAHLLRALRKRT